MATVKLTIDNIDIEVEHGKTVLEAAQSAGVYIPGLCAHPDLPPGPGTKADSVIYLGGQPHHNTDTDGEYHGCGLCVVEVDGLKEPTQSCTLAARDGMAVHANTPRVQELRRQNLKVILARHPHACLTCSQREGCIPFESCPNSLPVLERCCSKLGHCELQAVAEYVGIAPDTPRYVHRGLPSVNDEPLFAQDYNLCIGCTRCVRACRDLRGVGALGLINRNGEIVAGPIAPSLRESGCKFCGACVEVCPTGAMLDRDVKRAGREAALVPCSHACPAGIDVPRYVRLVAEGEFAEALAVVREKVPFPGVLGRVCFHPCESVCRRGQLDEPVAICALKRAAAGHDAGGEQSGGSNPDTGKKVAIVGSGPAGLTAGYYLAGLGHSVALFEALPEPGGMVRVGIPRYRLPGDVLDDEIERVRSTGVDIKIDCKVESLDSLHEQGYDAVFLAMGAHQGTRMNVEGEDCEGVIDGVSFLRDVNLGNEVKLGSRVAVIGGGNAAIDAARTALRLGAVEVTVVYRRSRDEMPASSEEVDAALDEGVKFLFLAAPKRISRNDGDLGLQCVRTELGEPDSSGRRRPTPVEGSEFEMAVDTVISAIGQAGDIPDSLEMDVVAGGRLKVDPETLATSTKGVFAGGDVATGPASVIEAIAAGRQAAASIDRYLGGRGDISESLAKAAEASPWIGRDEGFGDTHRAPMPCQPVEQRAGSFSEVETGLDQQDAAQEAGRCLRCDLRLRISPVMRPPDEWLELTQESVDAAPETDGVFRLFDQNKKVIYIGSGRNIREELRGLDPDIDEWVDRARYLHYEETLMYTMRESELLQQFLQEHGSLPEGNEEFF